MPINYSSDRSKIEDIKLVRNRTGCGLKEAKDAVERFDVNSVQDAIYKVLVDMGKVPGNVFWMVHVTNQRGPSHRHATLADAVEEAKRLCRVSPGAEVFVLRAEKVFQSTVDIKEGDCL